MKRSRHIQIYLKPGIREDDLMLSIWESCKRFDRPQDVFRAMLRNGMRAMVQSGEMPYAVVEECNLDAFIEKWRARQPTKTMIHTPIAAPNVYEHPATLPLHAYAPAYHNPAPAPQEKRPNVVDEPDPRHRNVSVDHHPVPEKDMRPQSPPPTQPPRHTQASTPSADKAKASGKRIGDLM